MPNPKPVRADHPASMFLQEADKDYIIARLVSLTGLALAGRAGYLAQQALEKYLKAVSVERRGEYLAIHDLKRLAAFCAEFDSSFSDSTLLQELTIFDDFAEVGRYGGAARYDPHAKRTPELQTAGVLSWSDDYRRLLDKLVFTVRSKLDMTKMGSFDHLSAIVRNDRTNLLVNEWKLGVPLREVLTTGNDYFTSQ